MLHIIINMGQGIDRFRFSCIDCATVIPTQEDIYVESCNKQLPSTKRQEYENSLKNLNGLEYSLANTESAHTQSSIFASNFRRDQKDSEVRDQKSYDNNARNHRIEYKTSVMSFTLPNNSVNEPIRRDTVNLHTLPASIKYRSRCSNISKVSVNLVSKIRSPSNSLDKVKYF